MRGSRCLSDLEIQSVSSHLNTRDRALFVVGVRTGYRISELLSLRLQDVVTAQGRILPEIYMARKSTKGRNEGRSVPLHPDATTALMAWVTEMCATHPDLPMETPLFISGKTKDGKIKSISRIQGWRTLTMAYADAGLTGKLGTHAMRKTFADRVYKKLNRDLVMTRAALGHKSIQSTVDYLAFEESDVTSAIISA
jgi:integrase